MAINPMTRKEAILSGEDLTPMNRKEAILSGEDLTPMNRDEYFLKIAANQSGNQNRVETIVGTLANPFGNMTESEWAAFQNAYETGDASATLEIDATVIGFDFPVSIVLDPQFNEATFVYSNIGGEVAVCANVSYYGMYPITLGKAFYSDGETVTDIKDYASVLPTTLTIYWHPMPTS